MRAFVARAKPEVSSAREHVILWAGAPDEVAGLDRPLHSVLTCAEGVERLNELLRARKCLDLVRVAARFGRPLAPPVGALELGGTFPLDDALQSFSPGSRRTFAAESSSGSGSARQAIEEFDAFAADGLAASPDGTVVVAEPFARWLQVRRTVEAWLTSKEALRRAKASEGEERALALSACAVAVDRYWGGVATAALSGLEGAESLLETSLAREVGSLLDRACSLDFGVNADGVGVVEASTLEAAILLSVLGAPKYSCRTCEQCGRPFFAKRGRERRYCTRACGRAHHSKPEKRDPKGTR